MITAALAFLTLDMEQICCQQFNINIKNFLEKLAFCSKTVIFFNSIGQNLHLIDNLSNVRPQHK